MQEAEHSIEESNAYEEEVENKSEEDADQSDEIQSSRNITGEAAKLMVKVTRHNLCHSLFCLKSER